MARLGGLARRKSLTAEERRQIARKASRAAAKARKKISPEQRQEIARKAARARWERQKPLPQSADH